MNLKPLLCAIGISLLSACVPKANQSAQIERADLILTNARVYTLDWGEPATNGAPAADAPWSGDSWQPDAEAVAMKGGVIVFVGDAQGVMELRSSDTRVVDLAGATVIPGLADTHSHVFELGAKLDAVDLTDVATEEEAVALVVERAKSIPEGEWIFGAGWDEGAWANRYPDKELLSKAVPNHPVALRSLHGFAVWVNQAALDAGEITSSSAVPTGGEVRLGADGEPNGLFLNRATEMVHAITPPASPATVKRQLLKGLNRMAEDGYVTIHEAGADAQIMDALKELEAEGRLPIRVFAMLSLRDEDLIRKWIAGGPDSDNDSMLVTRSVKAYYDGALGSRGARLLDDYADMPGHRGVSGDGYGFEQQLNAEAMKAGFQVGIHAIGDAGNREALDIIEAVFASDPDARTSRHRIEHAQVIAPEDMSRFAALDIIASMEPPHAVEDKTWAEDRLGSGRIRGAYAWRTLRKNGARITFNADNPGSDHSIFYGLHASVTRRDKQLQPEGGWYPEERLTIEEAIRAYTSWSAFVGFRENETGTIAVGRWADLTVMDIDPFVLANNDPAKILQGRILMTIVDGKVVFER